MPARQPLVPLGGAHNIHVCDSSDDENQQVVVATTAASNEKFENLPKDQLVLVATSMEAVVLDLKRKLRSEQTAKNKLAKKCNTKYRRTEIIHRSQAAAQKRTLGTFRRDQHRTHSCSERPTVNTACEALQLDP